MNEIRYVTLDPTGNITCLVLDPVSPALRPAVTARLLARCEQVGYLLPALDASARAMLQMMGGEFCGNASMATAAWLAREDGAKAETVVSLSVSGADGVLDCRVRPVSGNCWEGTVTMPAVLSVSDVTTPEGQGALVQMAGISHLILPDATLDAPRAEALLHQTAKELDAPSLGLMLWNSGKRFLRPLVFVRGSGSTVWETGCGSGSTAIGAWLALARGDGLTETDVRQPGGTIRVSVRVQGSKVQKAAITGQIRMGGTEILRMD